jgi:hypothetical protein
LFLLKNLRILINESFFMNLIDRFVSLPQPLNCYQKKEFKVGLAVGLAVIAALIAGLCIWKGLGQFHFSKMQLQWVDSLGHHCVSAGPVTVLGKFDFLKTFSFLGGGGAAIGCALFGIKRLVIMKLDRKAEGNADARNTMRSDSQSEDTFEQTRHDVDSIISLVKLVAGGVLLALGIYFLMNLTPAYHTDFNHVARGTTQIGYWAFKDEVMLAASIYITGAAFLTLGFLGVSHRLFKRRIEVTVIPVNDPRVNLI